MKYILISFVIGSCAALFFLTRHSPPHDTAVEELSIAAEAENKEVPERAPNTAQTITSNKITDSPELVAARAKVELFRKIIRSRDDNDPRLDTELRNLSDVDKRLLREEYNQLPGEELNQRGTIIFLLGRNLKTRADFDFMRQVLAEAPCESLVNCSQPDSALDSGDEFSQGVTLAYPQLVSLKSLKPFIDAPPRDPLLREEIKESLHLAASSRNPLVSKLALREMRRFQPR